MGQQIELSGCAPGFTLTNDMCPKGNVFYLFEIKG